MSKRIIALFLCLLLSLCAVIAQAEEPITVTDMFGREITLQKTPQRVVVLTASDCEILCALGCEDKLVARGSFCDYPASVLALPAVRSGYETNLEEILALEPDVVFMSGMDQSKEQVELLESSGVKVVVSYAQSVEGTYEAIRMIGRAMGCDARAEALVSDMQATFADIAQRSKASGESIYFEVSPLQWGLWTTGRGTFMHELAEMCGLTNAFGDLDGWGAVSEEQVLERDPDYIVSIAGMGETAVEEIKTRPGWAEVSAVAAGRVFNADSNAISRPGPRLKDAALELFGFIGGETPVN